MYHNVTNALLARMEQELQKILRNADNAIQQALEAQRMTEGLLSELKAFLIGYSFRSTTEEVRFFKEVKPQFSKEHLFYKGMLELELRRPKGDPVRLKQYLDQVLAAISEYLEHDQQFYLYYRLGRTDLDAQLFTRNAGPAFWMPPGLPDLDDRVATPYSLKLSKILAYEQLYQYASDLRLSAEQGQHRDAPGELRWSGGDYQFIELMLGLQAKGAINHGNLSLKQLVEKMGARLGFFPKNIHQAVKNIRSRAKDRTLYLHQLAESAEQWMDDRDL